jgi:hypothetical protein
MGQGRYDDPKRLTRRECQAQSRDGEDGIIAEILRRIGVKEKTFVEIGVGDGLENNTAYLFFHVCTGCLVDGGHEGSRAIRENLGWRLCDRTLNFIEMFVAMEKNTPALKSAGVFSRQLYRWASPIVGTKDAVHLPYSDKNEHARTHLRYYQYLRKGLAPSPRSCRRSSEITTSIWKYPSQ